MIRQRSDVALQRLELRAHLLRPLHVVGFGDDEGDDAADRHKTLAHLGCEVALAADGDQNIGIAFGVAGARRPLGFEDGAADRVDVGAGTLENIGAAIDHRFEQFEQHAFAIETGG